MVGVWHGHPLQKLFHVDAILIHPQYVHSHALTTSMSEEIKEFKTASFMRGFHAYVLPADALATTAVTSLHWTLQINKSMAVLSTLSLNRLVGSGTNI